MYSRSEIDKAFIYAWYNFYLIGRVRVNVQATFAALADVLFTR